MVTNRRKPIESVKVKDGIEWPLRSIKNAFLPMWKTVCKSCAAVGRYMRTNVFPWNATMCTIIGHSMGTHFSLVPSRLLTTLDFGPKGWTRKSQPLRQRLSAGRCHFQLRPKGEGIRLRDCLEKVPSGAVERQVKRAANRFHSCFRKKSSFQFDGSESGVSGKASLLGTSGSYLEVATQYAGPETAKRPWLDVNDLSCTS